MTDRPKIKAVFVLPALTAGGAERVLINLMNALDRDRFDPHFITVSDEGALRSLIAQDVPFQSLGKRRVSRGIFRLYKALKRIKPDVVVSTMAHMNFILLTLRPFFPKTRFIVREAITPSYILQEHPKLSPLLKVAYRRLYRLADHVISPAQAIIDEFENDLNMACEHHILLHNFVDVDEIQDAANAGRGEAETYAGGLHFVSAGRLHTQKGFDQLIEALAAVNLPDWRLDIWGKGPEEDALRALIEERGLQRRVRLMGFTQNPWAHFAVADCFVLPSRWEGMPNVVLESLACGTPVIATKQSGGIQEIADAASPDVVKVVDGMENFINAMNGARKKRPDAMSLSLLPERFEKDQAIRRFSSIVAGDADYIEFH